MALPTVTGVSPAGGPSTGGTLVTVTGTNFTKIQRVAFGLGTPNGLIKEGSTYVPAPPGFPVSQEYATEAALTEAYKGEVGGKVVGEGAPIYGYYVESATKIKVYAPPAQNENGQHYLSGGFNVNVTNSSGEQSAAAEANEYAYWGAHQITFIGSPGTGPDNARVIETVPLGLKKKASAYAASPFKFAGAEKLTEQLYAGFQDAAYITISLEVDEATKLKVLAEIETSYDGKNWAAPATAIATAASTAAGVKTKTVKLADIELLGPYNRLVLNQETEAGEFTGTATVIGTPSAPEQI